VAQTSFKLGVDGGGTKTTCLLVDSTGREIARRAAPGCNPSIVGTEQAGRIVTEGLDALRFHPEVGAGADFKVLLCMAGNQAFWREFAAGLTGFGPVTAVDDSLPVLELATRGAPGLVMHAGTGSFVAARAPDGTVHYAGGLGWRLDDPGSGYDIGRRAIVRALLELQGWSSPSGISPAVRGHARLGADADATALSRYFYQHSEPNQTIAALAPAVLALATAGDPAACDIVTTSATRLLALASRVATRLFPALPIESVPAGVSGPILNHPVVLEALTRHALFTPRPVEGTPDEGLRLLLARL